MQYNPTKTDMLNVRTCCKGCFERLLMITAYSCRLEEDDDEAFGAASGFEEVLVFALVFTTLLGCLRSTMCSSSPPDEANESCGLKYCPVDGRSRLLRRVEVCTLSAALSNFSLEASGFTDLLVLTFCDWGVMCCFLTSTGWLYSGEEILKHHNQYLMNKFDFMYNPILPYLSTPLKWICMRECRFSVLLYNNRTWVASNNCMVVLGCDYYLLNGWIFRRHLHKIHYISSYLSFIRCCLFHCLPWIFPFVWC
jgi:hypothetical protein